MPGNAVSVNESAMSMFTDPFHGGSIDTPRQASDVSELNEYIRTDAFSKHRDTLARVNWSRQRAEQDEDEGFHSDDDQASCSDLVTEPMTRQNSCDSSSMASVLPAEVLHQIFSLLQPCDFEAARHACRSWLVASLDRRLATTMMRRAGCYSAFLNDLDRSQRFEYLNEHWLASKRLATESRLSAAWHGSSLNTHSGHTSSRLSVRQTVDFTQLVPSEIQTTNINCERFTVSTCGKFLLATADRSIYVYAISSTNTAFEPVVQLVADTKVIAVSMDTSAGRFAVAALLEDRMGACWEIDDIVLHGAVGNLFSAATQQSKLDGQYPETGNVPGSSLVLSGGHDEISIMSEGVDISLPQAIQFQELEPTLEETSTFQTGMQEQKLKSAHLGASIRPSSFPIRVKPSAVYRNLGTKNDAPRCVAICPQRKCAAFGCRAGIELHWIDAATGSELNRWFPLAAPSDHLYFLPQRPGVNSAKKLRLISSAANPALESIRHAKGETSNQEGSSLLPNRSRARSMLQLFQSGRPASITTAASESQTNTARAGPRTNDCDHYRAVPLSDGQHMLFTDPISGLLCLGSDAPLGGPTKLVRKACMIPPHVEGVDQFESPVYYSAASDLRWGVRIVAAYADGRLVLYNIPSDCLEALRYIRSSPELWDEWTSGTGQSDLMTDAFISNRETARANAGQDETLFKPLRIDGALLGYVDADVEALSVDTANGGFRLWSFHTSGQATQMDIYVPKDHHMLSQVVNRDGSIGQKPLSPLPRAILKGHSNTPVGNFSSHGEDYFGSHVRFVGLDGCCDHTPGAMCGPMLHKDEIDYSHCTRDEGISMTPDAMTPDVSDDENDLQPLQVELLTDWRAESLLRPYIVNVTWIEAH